VFFYSNIEIMLWLSALHSVRVGFTRRLSQKIFERYQRHEMLVHISYIHNIIIILDINIPGGFNIRPTPSY